MSSARVEWARVFGLLGSVLSLLPLLASAQEVLVVDAMRKIRANEPSVPAASGASIQAARNEFEAFQIVVRGPATDVTATASALAGPGGATISAASCNAAGEVRLYREALYWVDPSKRSDVHSMTGWIPDALVPQVDEFDNQCRNFSFSVPAGEYRVVWVDVHVPRDAAPGTYTGTVTVSWTGGGATVPVTLRVWDFALPSTASLRSYFGYPYGAIITQHGTPACSSALIGLLNRYAVLALDHRMSFTALDDGCSYTNVAGAYTTAYGPLLDGTAPTRLAGARETGILYMGNQDSASALSAWTSHFRTRGWFERMFEYTADEPPHGDAWTVIGPRARLAHSVDPRFRILVVTSIERAAAAAPTNDFSVSDVDVFVPNVDQLEPAPAGNTRSAYDAWLAGSDVKEVWQYQSCDTHGCADANPVGSSPATGYYPSWPSYTIDASLVRARALEWFSFRNAITGELYYSTANAYYRTSPGPWADQWDYTGHGDGTLFYPGTPAQIGGTTHVPVASMRMRMIREGMEDYEYMRLLDSQGERQYALEQVATVFGPASDSDRDPDALYGARERMACRILANLGKPCAPPAQASLAVRKGGTGAGTVTSVPAGIDCGAGCSSQSAPFATGSVVTLTAIADPGSTFAGFGGACTSSSTSCAFTLAADAAATATFDAPAPAPCTADDCFDRTDGALGSAWNVFAPGIDVQSGQARSTTTGGKGARYLESVGADQDVSVRCLVAGSGSNCAVLARYSDPGTYYYAYLDAGLGQLALWRKSGGASTRLGAATRAIASGTYHPLRLVVRGSALEVYFGGESSPAISAVDSGIATGGYGGIHGYAGGIGTVSWDDFTIVAAPPPEPPAPPPPPPPPLFSDGFDRTTGLGASWSVRYGSFGTDGTFAVSGSPSGNGDLARLVAPVGTDDYSVTARLVVPPGSLRSGVAARVADSSRYLYAAQLSTANGGSVTLFRRNRSSWTQLATVPWSVVPGTVYSLKLTAAGTNPVHLEISLDGSVLIRRDDASAGRLTTGPPGMQSSGSGVKYDSFTVELP